MQKFPVQADYNETGLFSRSQLFWPQAATGAFARESAVY